MMLDEWSEKARLILDEKKNPVKKTMSTIEYLELVTTQYLESAEQQQVRDKIAGCATVLVNYRRSRARNGAGAEIAWNGSPVERALNDDATELLPAGVEPLVHGAL
jgi:hypothetical protein